jgi:hypothetical protein
MTVHALVSGLPAASNLALYYDAHRDLEAMTSSPA